jgi:hypothetical protein
MDRFPGKHYLDCPSLRLTAPLAPSKRHGWSAPLSSKASMDHAQPSEQRSDAVKRLTPV